MMTSQLLNKLIQFGSQPVLTIKLNIWRGRGYECGPLHFSGIIIYALDKGYWSQRFGYMNAQPQIQTRFCMKFRGKKRLMWQIFTDHITRCLYYNWVLKFLWFAHYTSDWLSHLPRHFTRRKSVWSPLYATLGQCARQEFFPPKLDLHKKLAIQVVLLQALQLLPRYFHRPVSCTVTGFRVVLAGIAVFFFFTLQDLDLQPCQDI